MLEEPAMFKPLSYSSEFVSIRQPFVLSTDNANFQAKNIRAGSPDLFMSMLSSIAFKFKIQNGRAQTKRAKPSGNSKYGSHGH